jgi:hypothetical protein
MSNNNIKCLYSVQSFNHAVSVVARNNLVAFNYDVNKASDFLKEMIDSLSRSDNYWTSSGGFLVMKEDCGDNTYIIDIYVSPHFEMYDDDFIEFSV